eukprot:122623-Pyramimonas_sp.AAC.1
MSSLEARCSASRGFGNLPGSRGPRRCGRYSRSPPKRRGSRLTSGRLLAPPRWTWRVSFSSGTGSMARRT